MPHRTKRMKSEYMHGYYKRNRARILAYHKEYRKRPETKALRRKRESTPKAKAWKKDYQKRYKRMPKSRAMKETRKKRHRGKGEPKGIPERVLDRFMRYFRK